MIVNLLDSLLDHWHLAVPALVVLFLILLPLWHVTIGPFRLPWRRERPSATPTGEERHTAQVDAERQMREAYEAERQSREYREADQQRQEQQRPAAYEVEQQRMRDLLEDLKNTSQHTDPYTASDAPKSADWTIERIPHMDIEPPQGLVVGNIFSVIVYADVLPTRPGEQIEPISIKVPSNISAIEVQVWLAVFGELEVLGDATRHIRIHRDKKQPSNRAIYQVRAKTLVDGEARITAYFQYKGNPCGQVSRRLKELEQDRAVEETVEQARIIEEPSAPPPAACQSKPYASEPDLTVWIATDPNHRDRVFLCSVTTPHFPAYREPDPKPWHLPEDAPELVRKHMNEFTRKDMTPLARRDALTGAGLQFFKVAPPNFVEVFWKLIDAEKRLDSILVVTQEPSFPWELMVPRRETSVGLQTLQPIGVKYSVSRWLRHDSTPPPQQIKIESCTIVAPKYPGPKPRPLAHALDETLYLMGAFRGQLAPADYDSFDGHIKQHHTSLLHFICHGSDPDDGLPYLCLENNERLLATQVSAMEGMIAFCGRRYPFIFLNACEVGRGVPSLVSVTGFADQFTEVGAGCVIAPLWSVKDDVAHLVATEFYDCVKKHPSTPYATILRNIRSKSYVGAGGEDTYAAYCFYGHPLASAE